MIEHLMKSAERKHRKKTTLGQHTLISVEGGYDNAGKTTFYKSIKK